jgi:hypothetical protein
VLLNDLLFLLVSSDLRALVVFEKHHGFSFRLTDIFCQAFKLWNLILSQGSYSHVMLDLVVQLELQNRASVLVLNFDL